MSFPGSLCNRCISGPGNECADAPGAYEAQYISLTGVSQSYLKQLNLGEGRIPAPGEMGMVFGNGVLQRFTNAKTGKGYWDTGELPDVDLMGKPIFVVLIWMLIIKAREAAREMMETV